MSEFNSFRKSVLMDGADTRVELHRCVGRPDSTNKALVAGVGDDVYGITTDYVTTNDTPVSVDVLGEITVEAHAAFAAGVRLKAAALGRAAAAIAKLTTALDGENNNMEFTAVASGRDGDLVSIEYTNPDDADQSLDVSVNGKAINVSLATNAGSAITSTAAQIKAAIEALPSAAALVTVANAGSDTGAGVVTAMPQTFLTGGGGDFATALKAATAQGQYIPAIKDHC